MLAGMTTPALQPGHATFLREFLLAPLASEHRITKKIFRAVPPGRDDYRPHARSMSALELARHIAICELWFIDAVIHRRFDDITPFERPMDTCHDVAHWYAEQFAGRLPLLVALTDEELATPVPYLDLRRDPAVAYLGIAVRHSVHHRGQLSAYLRPMGATVPAIYVESGDEPYPAEAGSTGSQAPPAF